MPQPVTIITGASAGIGVELARIFAKRGHRLLLIARREQRLERLADQIAGSGQSRPVVLPLDLASPGAVERISAALAAHDLEPEYIVNNAGFGLIGPVVGLVRAEQLALVDLNVRALTDLSLAWLDSLTRRRGGILNVGSVAGFLPGPGSTLYYASKAFVVSFSEALHAELAPLGVRVTVLCPGPVPSEFQLRAGADREFYPPVITVPAESVAEAGYRGLMRGRRRVVPGWVNKVIVAVAPLVPRALLLRLVAMRQARRTPATR